MKQKTQAGYDKVVVAGFFHEPHCLVSRTLLRKRIIVPMKQPMKDKAAIIKAIFAKTLLRYGMNRAFSTSTLP